jgi:hypothetical protein
MKLYIESESDDSDDDKRNNQQKEQQKESKQRKKQKKVIALENSYILYILMEYGVYCSQSTQSTRAGSVCTRVRGAKFRNYGYYGILRHITVLFRNMQ